MEYEEEEQLRKVVKFIGITLDDSEKEELTNAWYFHYILNGRTSFFKTFDNKTIACKFIKCRPKNNGGELMSQSIFKCEEFNIKKPRPFNRDNGFSYTPPQLNR